MCESRSLQGSNDVGIIKHQSHVAFHRVLFCTGPILCKIPGGAFKEVVMDRKSLITGCRLYKLDCIFFAQIFDCTQKRQIFSLFVSTFLALLQLQIQGL